jgi:hypothetical protein
MKVVARLFRATPQREPDPRSLRSEANQERWHGIIETAGQALERYERTRNACTRSSIRASCVMPEIALAQHFELADPTGWARPGVLEVWELESWSVDGGRAAIV